MYNIKDINITSVSRNLEAELKALDQKLLEAADELTVLEAVKESTESGVMIDGDDVQDELDRQISAKTTQVAALTVKLEILERSRIVVAEQLEKRVTTPTHPPVLALASTAV